SAAPFSASSSCSIPTQQLIAVCIDPGRRRSQFPAAKRPVISGRICLETRQARRRKCGRQAKGGHQGRLSPPEPARNHVLSVAIGTVAPIVALVAIEAILPVVALKANLPRKAVEATIEVAALRPAQAAAATIAIFQPGDAAELVT